MKNCSNIECRNGPEDICYNGVDPVTECLEYGRGDEVSSLAAEVVDSDLASVSVPEEDELDTFESEYISTHSGDILFAKDASRIMQRHGGQVIACVGSSDVGKTTLISSLYELFGEGAVGAYTFAGSKTIFHFERICHQSRFASKRETPETDHTERTGIAKFHHLTVCEDGVRKDLFLSDRAGEDYTDAKDSDEFCKTLFEVERANTVMLLVDAYGLGDVGKRHVTKSRVSSLTSRLVSNNMIGRETNLILVMTRFDLVKDTDKETLAMAELNRLKIGITDKTKNIVNSFSSIITAARPTKSVGLKAGYGIDELIELLVNPKALISIEKEVVDMSPSRNFHKIRACI